MFTTRKNINGFWQQKQRGIFSIENPEITNQLTFINLKIL